MTTFSALSSASLIQAPRVSNEVSAAINEKLSDLYRIAERSLHVFGSPAGPLSIADDIPVQPFELVVGIPSSWSTELYAESAASILKRFIVRHRGFISYAQHL